jgi:YidC/Oxa1 family membrane protein insertase
VESNSSNIQSVSANTTDLPPISPLEEPLAGSSPPISESVVQSPPSDALPDGVIDTVTSYLPDALQYGDLSALGLISWTPAGLYRWVLEIINVTTGLPWGYTVIVGAVLARLALFPFTARGIRDSARLAPYSLRIKQLQEELSEASKTRDTVKMQRLSLKQKQIYKEANVNLVQSVVNGLVQIPVTLGMFFGVKKICEFPVEQLKYSGIDMIPDLTIADPTWMLPVLCTVLINVQMRVDDFT